MVEYLKAGTLYITFLGFKGAKVRRAYKVYMHIDIYLKYLVKADGTLTIPIPTNTADALQLNLSIPI